MGEWKYLCSEPFKIRHLIAAHHLKDCPRIIEIGGFRTPISSFLAHSYEHVLSVDPLIEPLQTKKILHANEDFRFFDFKPFLKPRFGLVMLGMDLPFDFKLFQMAASASKIIVEFPPAHLPSKLQFELLQQTLRLEIDLKVGLDLSKNDFGNLDGSHPVFAHRELYVLTAPTAG